MTDKTTKRRGRGKVSNLNAGGTEGNAGGEGRPTNESRAICLKLIREKNLWERAAQIAAGDPIEEKHMIGAGGAPVVVKCPARPEVQLKALEMLADRAEGKPSMSEDDSKALGASLSTLTELLMNSRKERGLD